jgi:hypothetical protein
VSPRHWPHAQTRAGRGSPSSPARDGAERSSPKRRTRPRETLYAAKCYWPGITQAELERAAAAAVREAEKVSRTGNPVTYRGSLLFPNDELVLCLFAAASPAAIQQTTDDAGIPSERLMDTLWMPNPNTSTSRSSRPT